MNQIDKSTFMITLAFMMVIFTAVYMVLLAQFGFLNDQYHMNPEVKQYHMLAGIASAIFLYKKYDVTPMGLLFAVFTGPVTAVTALFADYVMVRIWKWNITRREDAEKDIDTI